MKHHLSRALRGALRSPRPSPTFHLQRRCVSSTSRTSQGPHRRMPKERDREKRRKTKSPFEQGTEVENDAGLLPDTFVMPTRRDQPSLWRAPRALFRMHWVNMKARFVDVGSLLVFKMLSPTGKRWYNRALKMERRSVAPTAVRLHATMYEALAGARVGVLHEICCNGILMSLMRRLDVRPRGEKVQWQIVRYNKSPKVMSDRLGRMPRDGWGLRQAVVRISSRQRLTRYVDGNIVPGTGVEKDVVEDFVVQTLYRGWQPEEWKVWGTTTGTTWQELVDRDKRALEEKERANARFRRS